jgi:TPR repeat protein
VYGSCLRSGIGVAQNESDSARYFKLSADEGYAPAKAAYSYSSLLWRILFRFRDPYVKASGHQSIDAAQSVYNVCLRDEKGVSQNLQWAALQATVSADQANSPVRHYYGVLYPMPAHNQTGELEDRAQNHLVERSVLALE